MKLFRILMVLALVFPGSTVFADGTMRYQNDIKPGKFFPPEMTAKFMAALQQFEAQTAYVMQIKGDKREISMADTKTIVDFSKQQITRIDAAHKLYATVYVKDYMSELQSTIPPMSTSTIPPQAKMFLQMTKFDIKSEKTGRTEEILGVHTEETVWFLSVELPAGLLPLPAGAVPADQPLVLARFEGHAWIATPEEISRVPALAEMTARQSMVTYMVNLDSILKPLEAYPNVNETIVPIIRKFVADPPMILKMNTEIYLPVVAQIAPMLKAQGRALPPGLDPAASLAEVDSEMTELSSAPVSDAVFQVPADYQATPMADLIKAAVAAKATAPAAPVHANPGTGGH